MAPKLASFASKIGETLRLAGGGAAEESSSDDDSESDDSVSDVSSD